MGLTVLQEVHEKALQEDGSYETPQQERERIIAAIFLLKDWSILVTTIGLGVIAAIGVLLGLYDQDSAKAVPLTSRVTASFSVLCFFISSASSVYLVSSLPGVVQRLDEEIQRQRRLSSEKHEQTRQVGLFFKAVFQTLLPFWSRESSQPSQLEVDKVQVDESIDSAKTINIWDMGTFGGSDEELRVSFWFHLQLSSFFWGTLMFAVFIVLILIVTPT